MLDREALIGPILEREKGWADRPEDRGGPTNWGFKLSTFREVSGQPVATVEDLRALTRERAAELYWNEYLRRPRILEIPDDDLLAVVADWAVNSGASAAIRGLQAVLGVPADGVIGPVTLAVVRYRDGRKLARLLLAQRADFVAGWAPRDLTDADRDGIPDSLENLRGLIRRITDQWRALA